MLADEEVTDDVLAACWHHFVRRDQILMRMWPDGSGD
jgi:cytochrome b561